MSPCSSVSVASASPALAPDRAPVLRPCRSARGPSSERTLTSPLARPRSEYVSPGVPTLQFPASARTITSDARSSAYSREERREVGRADLLLTLDEHLHVARERALGVEPRLDHRTRGRRRRPCRRRSRGRRGGRRARPVRTDPTSSGRRIPAAARRGAHTRGRSARRRACIHSPMTAGRRVLDGGLAHVLEAARLEIRRGCVGAVLHVDVAIGVGADARDADEVLEHDPGVRRCPRRPRR